MNELGVCPAATETSFNGANNGCNAGRFCWKVAGTLCGGQVQGSFAQKISNCMQCDFKKEVEADEGKQFRLM